MTVGIKISLPGKDVRTCAPKDCSLHSEYTAFKARTIGSTTLTANTWREITHNYGYEPAYFGWFTGNFGGISGIAPIGGTPIIEGSASSLPYVESYVTTSKLYLRSNISTTVYYYIFADLAGSVSSSVPIPDYGEFGLMITKPGVNVLEAKPYQLNFLSTYPNFKVHSEPFKESGAIDKTPTTHQIHGDSGATTIRFDNANDYGSSGEIMIFNTVLIDNSSWQFLVRSTDGTWEYKNITEYELKKNARVRAKPTGGFEREGWYINGELRSDSLAKYETINNNPCSYFLRFYYRGSTGQSWEQAEFVDMYYVDNDNREWKFVDGTRVGECYQEFRNEKVSFTSTDSQYFYGCTRGIDGTTIYYWAPGAYIKPITMVHEVANRPTSYNPCFLAWSLGLFDLDITAYPLGHSGYQYQIVLSGSKFYLVSRYSWSGDMSWGEFSIPQQIPNCYLKIMHDEIGT